MKMKNSIGIALAGLLAFTSVSQAAYNPNNPNGQATMANSAPVAIASDQTALPLSTGAATSANQTTGNTSLSTIATNTTGAATAANQSTGNTSLAAIQGSVANIPASPANAANQATANTSLSAIATSTGNIPAPGQKTGVNSLPVTLSAPVQVLSASFSRPANVTQYTALQAFSNSTTAGSVTPLSWSIAPSNGVPVYVLKGLLQTQTSGAAGVSVINGSFRLYLYNQLPTVASGDGATFSSSMANFCGSLAGSLLSQGTDWTVAEMVPEAGAAVECTPAAGSSTIYGLMQVTAAFTPTSAELSQIKLTVQ